MSKKHRHNNNGGGQPQTTNPEVGEGPATGVDALAASLTGEAEDTPNAERTDVTSEAPGETADRTEEAAEVSPAEVESAKKPEEPKAEAPAPAAVEVAAPKPAVRIVTMCRPVQVTKKHIETVKKINAEVPEDLRLHTTAGRQLIAMFDEYDKMCAKTSETDEQGQIACARKLYDIMNLCCPRRGNPNAGVYNEIIRIVFKRLSQGYGTKYKDSSLFRMDYRLPSPVESMKFDTFWNVMYQLVESAKIGTRITFNNTTVARILNSPAAMTTIMSIRRNLEHAN